MYQRTQGFWPLIDARAAFSGVQRLPSFCARRNAEVQHAGPGGTTGPCGEQNRPWSRCSDLYESKGSARSSGAYINADLPVHQRESSAIRSGVVRLILYLSGLMVGPRGRSAHAQLVAAARGSSGPRPADDRRLELVGDLGGRVGRDDRDRPATRVDRPLRARSSTGSAAAASGRSPRVAGDARHAAQLPGGLDAHGVTGPQPARDDGRPRGRRLAARFTARDRQAQRLARAGAPPRARTRSSNSASVGPAYQGHRGGALADVVAVLGGGIGTQVDVRRGRAARPASGAGRRCGRRWPAASVDEIHLVDREHDVADREQRPRRSRVGASRRVTPWRASTTTTLMSAMGAPPRKVARVVLVVGRLDDDERRSARRPPVPRLAISALLPSRAPPHIVEPWDGGRRRIG